MKGISDAQANKKNHFYYFGYSFCYWFNYPFLFTIKNMNHKIAQESDEEIVEELRRHPIILINPLSKVFFGFIIVILIFALFGASGIFSIFFFIWLIFGGLYSIYHYYIWKKDAYILTDSRIIIREQVTFFSKQVREAGLKDITDVTYKVKGFWATLFNFGTVRAETASSDALKLVDISKPHKVQKLILDLREKYLKTDQEEMTARELISKLENSKEIKKDTDSIHKFRS